MINIATQLCNHNYIFFNAAKEFYSSNMHQLTVK